MQDCGNLNFIFITEHWMKSENFTRLTSTHGGVMILTSKDKNVRPLANINNLSDERHCELTSISCKYTKTVAESIYKSPSGSFEMSMEIMGSLLRTISAYSRVIIAGDFNVKFNDVNNINSSLCDLSYGYQQTIYSPTRNNNFLDNILLNFSKRDFCANVINTALSLR